MMLVSGRAFVIEVDFRHPNHGIYEDRLEIVLEDLSINQRFAVVRPVRAIVGNRADYEELRPKAPYVPRKKTSRDPEKHIVPGVPPAATNTVRWVTRLPLAEIPKTLSDILYSSSKIQKVVPKVRTRRLPPHLDENSYSQQFCELLWTEEFRMQ